ncbi:MAG: hypothetical protein LUQ59_05015 [Methanothrix sp.]|nr:hypothetical protein [Methanothrix sp.]
MDNAILVSKSNKIQDIPSLKKARSDAKNLETLKKAMPILRPGLRLIGGDIDQIDRLLEEVDDMVESVNDLATIPDRFNDHFAPLGWIMYEEMDHHVAKTALEKADSGDIEGAEACLVDYYEPEMVQQKLQRMMHIVEFRSRMPLAQKALIDYREERYHACVPVVLALADGLVNELHLKARGKRLGFSAEAVDLAAWDSVSAHSKGLGELVCILMKDRKKTTTQQITIPFRHGIMHGMDLGYDNKKVAAKTWAALFALRDWGLKAEKGAINPPSEEKNPTVSDIFNKIKKNEETKKRQQDWKPRNIKPGQDIPVSGKPDQYDAGSPEQTLAEFFGLWIEKNYGFMAKICISSDLKSISNPRDVNLSYKNKLLEGFEFKEIKDQAAAITVITVLLICRISGEETKRTSEFRLIYLDPDWRPEVRGYSNGKWFIINWDML